MRLCGVCRGWFVGLPGDTRALLLAAAADPTGDPGLLWRAGHDLGFSSEAAAPAEARQLITIRDAVVTLPTESVVLISISCLKMSLARTSLALVWAVSDATAKRQVIAAAAAVRINELYF